MSQRRFSTVRSLMLLALLIACGATQETHESSLPAIQGAAGEGDYSEDLIALQSTDRKARSALIEQYDIREEGDL